MDVSKFSPDFRDLFYSTRAQMAADMNVGDATFALNSICDKLGIMRHLFHVVSRECTSVNRIMEIIFRMFGKTGTLTEIFNCAVKQVLKRSCSIACPSQSSKSLLSILTW